VAHDIAVRQTRRPSVVLVSDLDDNPGDVTRLGTVLLAYRRDRVPITIVGLNPAPGKLAFFRGLLGSRAGTVVQAPTLDKASRPRNADTFPWVLVVLAAATAVALAAHELWAPRLTWGTR
jgi:hypothetical protein